MIANVGQARETPFDIAPSGAARVCDCRSYKDFALERKARMILEAPTELVVRQSRSHGKLIDRVNQEIAHAV